MPRDRLLASSIFALAAAIALHGLAPAIAQDAPVAPAAPVAQVAPVAPVKPACKNVRVGTAKEVAALIADLQEQGRDDFLVVGSGLVCGW